MNLNSRREAVYYHPSLVRPEGMKEGYALTHPRGTSFAKLGKRRALRKFLLPFDGSPASICAVKYVIRNSVEGFKIHLVNVQPPIMAGDVSFLMSASMVANIRRAAGQDVLDIASALLDAHYIKHTAEVVLGSPVKAIVDCAAERRCTKIVMGTKGRSLLGNLVARSVASRVVRIAHVPVTLIKERAAAQIGGIRTAPPGDAHVGGRASDRYPRRDGREPLEVAPDLTVMAPPLLLEHKHEVGEKQQQVDCAQ